MPKPYRTLGLLGLLAVVGCNPSDDSGPVSQPGDDSGDTSPADTAPPSVPEARDTCLLGDPGDSIVADDAVAERLWTDEADEATHLGFYRSHVYRVSYQHQEQAQHTYLRLDLPCLPGGVLSSGQRPQLGMVLVVEGGGGLSQQLAVREDSRLEGQRDVIIQLASGSPNTDETVDWYRAGGAMVVATPTQPGRGLEAEGLLATGLEDIPSAGFPWHTPSNEHGQDYGGTLSVQALEAVAAVQHAVVQDLMAKEEALAGVPTRLVVFSASNGLALAARWVVSTERQVHALVDFEGPTDGMEQTKGSWTIDPFGLSGEDLPATPSWEAWAAAFGSGIDTYYFRPPPAMLSLLPDEATLFEDSQIARNHTDFWLRWYGEPAYQRDTLASEQAAFWSDREATPWLAQLHDVRCAYVRLQKLTDHAMPDWLMQRHAVRAMNAAWADGAHPHVYWTDVQSYQSAVVAREDGTPARFDSAQDEDAWEVYREWWPDRRLGWTLQLDLVRWAVAEDFDW